MPDWSKLSASYDGATFMGAATDLRLQFGNANGETAMNNGADQVLGSAFKPGAPTI